MPASFSTLPAELCRKIYLDTHKLGHQTTWANTLVCTDFAHVFFLLLHDDLIIEAYVYNPDFVIPPDIPPNAPTYLDTIRGLTDQTWLRHTVRTLTIRGPTKRRRLELGAAGMGLLKPVLTCCDIYGLLSLLPNVDALVVTEVFWDKCRSHSKDSCRSSVVPRLFQSIAIRYCTIVTQLLHPFNVLQVVSSVDHMDLGLVNGISSRVVSLGSFAARKVTLRDIAESRDYNFDLLDAVPSSGVEEVVAEGLAQEYIFDLACLLTLQRESVRSLTMDIKAETIGACTLQLALTPLTNCCRR